MNEMKTGFDWCVQEWVRPLDLSEWDTQLAFYEDSFYEEKINALEFFRRIQLMKVKANSRPRKTALYLEYRMYGFVPYNLSPIQQGIQFGHAVVRYGQKVKAHPELEKIYDKYATKDETFIILNGGTTNEHPDRLGTLQRHTQTLKENGIFTSEFREIDINDTQTAVVFLVDERVFNRELYPDFVENTNTNTDANTAQFLSYQEKIGGPSNLFLRSFLPQFRLA